MDRYMKYKIFDKSSLRVGMLIFLAMTMPALLTFIIYFSQELVNVEDHEKAHTNYILEETARDIDFEINTCLQELKYLSEQYSIKTDTISTQLKLNELRNFIQQNTTLADITLIDTKGEVITSLKYNYLGDWKEKSWFKLASTGKIAVSPVYLTPGAYTSIITICMPIKSEAGRISGVIAADLDINEIFQNANNNIPDVISHIIITDRSGRILYHPDPDQILEFFPDDNSKKLLTENESGKYIYSTQGENPQKKYCTFNIMKGYKDYPGQKWRISLVKNNTFTQNFKSSYSNLLAITLIVCSLSSLVIVYISNRYFLIPIKNTLKNMHNLGSNNGNITDNYNISLVQSINNIGQKLCDYVKMLEQSEKEKNHNQQKRIKLKNLIKNLTKINKGKDELLESITYKTRTPLSSIIGYTEELIMNSNSDETAKKLNTILYESEFLLETIDEIIEDYKIQSGKIKLSLKACDLFQLIETVRHLVTPKAENRGLNLQIEIADGVPQYIISDQLKLRQIIINLLSCAIDNAKDDTIALIITTLNRNKTNAQIRFSINGCKTIKINDNEIPTFSTKEHNFGSLANSIIPSITKRLAELLDAKIQIRKNENTENVIHFEISVQLCDSTRLKQLNDFETINIYDSKTRLSKHKILLVEDYKTNQNLLINQLNKLEIKTDLAQNGREAVEMTRIGKYDLILMDIQMPIMDGIMAAKLIRSYDNFNKNVPIIALTADADPELKNKCLNSRMNDLMEKPVRAAKLAAVLEKWLNKDNQQVENAFTEISKSSALNTDNSDHMQIWNKERAIELFDNNESLMENTVKDFIRDVELQIRILNEAIDRSNLNTVEKEIQKIKNGAFGIGADQLSSVARDIENNLYDCETDNIKILMQNLISNFKELKNETRKNQKATGN